MRSSHRRSLNVGVTAVSIGTVNGIRLAEVFLTAGRKDVHLRSPVRIAGLVVIRRHRSHADNPVVITGELQSVLTGVARSEHDESALHGARLHSVLIHAGVVDEVIEPRLQVGSEVRRGDLPAAGSNDRSVVGRIGKHVPVGNRLPVVRQPSDSHYPHAVAVTRTARDSADSLAVVVHGGNRTGDMRPVVSGHYLAAVVIRSEVPSVQVVHVSVVVIVHAFCAVHLGLVYPHVGSQVGVVVLHAHIHHGHDDIRTARIYLPSFEQVDVGPFDRLLQ